MATKRRSSKEILAIIEAAIQKASDEGRDFADTSLDMPGEEVSPLTGYGVEADEIFAEANIRSGTQLGQYIARLKEDIAFVGPRQEVAQPPITEPVEVPSAAADPTVTPIAEEVEEEVDPSLQRAFAAYPEIDRAADEEVDAEIGQGVPAAKSTVTVPEEAAVDAGPKETLAELLGAGRQQGPPQPPGDLGPGKAEAILGILEVLGGLGGKIAQGRAMRRADKKTEQSQRVANLINALSRGRAGAQATTAQPRMGTGGQVLSALGGVGRMGGRLVDAQKKAKAEDWGRQMKEWGASTELGLAEDKLRLKQEEIDAKILGDTQKKRDHLSKGNIAFLATHIPPGTDPADVATKAAEVLSLPSNQVPPEFRDTMIPAMVSAYTEAEAERIAAAHAAKTDELDLAMKSGELLEAAFSRVRPNKEYIRGLAEKSTKYNETTISPIVSGLYSGTFDAIADYVGGEWAQREDGKWENSKTGDIVSEKEYREKGVGSRVNILLDKEQQLMVQKELLELRAIYDIARYDKHQKYLDKREELIKNSTPSNAQKLFFAEAEVMEDKISRFEALYDDLPFKGPVGSLAGGISQYLTPKNFIYDDTMEAFALEMASLLNQGRPSEVDFKSAKRMMPLSSDSPEVARAKFENLKRVVAYSQLALERQIYLPLHLKSHQAFNDGGHFKISEEELARMENRNLGHADFVDKAHAKLLAADARTGSKFAKQMIVDVAKSLGGDRNVENTPFAGLVTQVELDGYIADEGYTGTGEFRSQESGARTQQQKAFEESISKKTEVEAPQ